MKAIAFLKGLGLGAAGMYWFDSRLGRRRRAMLEDRLVHLTHASDFIERGTRDLTNRMQPLLRFSISSGTATRWTTAASR